MCGISGIYNFDQAKVNINILKKINNAMVDRGPDDEGYFLQNNIGIGNRRLSIIDIKNGKQPISNFDNTVFVVLNGEIYNYLELKDELLKKGYKFKNNSDTEVLLYLYEEYHENMLSHINGIFSFAIWDSKKKIFFIARDRLGVKPLYYFLDQNRFIFASSLKAIANGSFTYKKCNLANINNFFLFGYFKNEETVWENFFKLKPGNYIYIKNNVLSIKTYWSNKINIDPAYNEKYKTSVISELINDSIRLQSRSDVKIASLLSGGIDSSIISKLLNDCNNKKLISYNLDFQQKNNNDTKFAELLSNKENINLKVLPISEFEVKKILKESIIKMDEPLSDTSLIAQFFIFNKIKDDCIKVVHTGCGADEVFGGYKRHYFNHYLFNYFNIDKDENFFYYLVKFFPEISNYIVKLFNKNIRFILSGSGINIEFLYLVFNRDIFLKTLEGVNDTFVEFDHNVDKFGYLYSAQNHDLNNYLPNNILSLVDQASSSSSIEARTPFLDHRIVEASFRIPKKISQSNLKNSKFFLKKIYSKIILEDIFYRKKVGFNSPVNTWINNDIMFYENNLIKSEVINKIINIKNLKNILNSPKLKKKYANSLFMLFVLDNWLFNNA